MKKLFTIFIFGQLVICSILFNKSIYSIYGVMYIGDTSLNGYRIEDFDSNQVELLYDQLVKEDATLQVIKMPISKELDTVDYHIYHSDVENISKFISISNNHYKYDSLTKEEFLDGTGIFYTDLNYEKLQEISHSIGISIVPYEDTSYISFHSILLANTIDFIVLGISTIGVIFIYVISKKKANAIKSLLGYSDSDIIQDRIKEISKIQGISILLISGYHILYYYLQHKCSFRYAVFLIAFLLGIACINLLLMRVTSVGIKRMNLLEAIKNKMFSKKLDYIVQAFKIVLLLMLTIAISNSLIYYQQLKGVESKMKEYEQLNNFFTSYGYNSDEYEKMMNNNTHYLEMADKVKQMYQKYVRDAYVMVDCVLEPENIRSGEPEEDVYGMTKEELFQSYEKNYIICNENYIEDYTSIPKILGEVNSENPTLIVPAQYKQQEKKIRQLYSAILEDKYTIERYYGREISIAIKPSDLNLIYVKNNYSVKLLSDFQYEDSMDITIENPIIIVDTGNFSGIQYMDMLSNCQLAFLLEERTQYSDMLIEAGIEQLFAPHTMLAPFMTKISSYQFIIEQTGVFLILFFLTLLFLLYISNDIHIYVNCKRYAVKYELGYHTINILKQPIITIIMLLIVGIGLSYLGVNPISYILFVIIDFIFLCYCYYKVIVKDLYKILNGGC